MASNKRTRGLDQSTRDSLKGIDKLLADLADAGSKRDDEFTLKEFVDGAADRGIKTSMSASTRHLAKLVKQGTLETRKIAIMGNQTNVFRVVG